MEKQKVNREKKKTVSFSICGSLGRDQNPEEGVEVQAKGIDNIFNKTVAENPKIF
jgi:hypothetical protein